MQALSRDRKKYLLMPALFLKSVREQRAQSLLLHASTISSVNSVCRRPARNLKVAAKNYMCRPAGGLHAAQSRTTAACMLIMCQGHSRLLHTCTLPFELYLTKNVCYHDVYTICLRRPRHCQAAGGPWLTDHIRKLLPHDNIRETVGTEEYQKRYFKNSSERASCLMIRGYS